MVIYSSVSILVVVCVCFRCGEQHLNCHFCFKEETTLRRTNTELESKANELERITRSAERLQQEVDDLIEQRRTVLSGLTKLQDERVLMEEGQRNTDKMISQLKRCDRKMFTMSTGHNYHQ